jgi:hypothetical protein
LHAGRCAVKWLRLVRIPLRVAYSTHVDRLMYLIAQLFQPAERVL